MTKFSPEDTPILLMGDPDGQDEAPDVEVDPDDDPEETPPSAVDDDEDDDDAEEEEDDVAS